MLGPEQGARYLAKYFSKTFEQREALEKLGFLRRYSTSGGWPRLDYQLAGMKDENFLVANYEAWYRELDEDVERSESDPAVAMVGSSLVVQKVNAGRIKRWSAMLQKAGEEI